MKNHKEKIMSTDFFRTFLDKRFVEKIIELKFCRKIKPFLQKVNVKFVNNNFVEMRHFEHVMSFCK